MRCQRDGPGDEHTCNLEIVSLLPGAEAGTPSFSLAFYEDCAYYNQDYPGTSGGGLAQPGAVVVDASDRSTPVVTGYLDTPAFLDPHESMNVHQGRALLGGVAGWDPVGNGPVYFDVYDVSTDCSQPVLKASLPLNMPTGHEGDFAYDGKTYYGSSLAAQVITPIDVTDPANPSRITEIPIGSHGLATNDDGTRLYITALAFTGAPVTPTAAMGEGLVILDTSQVQARAPNASARKISELIWDNGEAAQIPIPVKYADRPFIVFVEEFGNVRIIDIAEESAPFIVSEINLEAQLAGTGGSPHFCSVDRRNDPTVLGCTYWSGGHGVRVFDIRDPYLPKEIAYYVASGSTASAKVRFVRETGEIWFTDPSYGFYVARFTNGVWPFK